MTGVTGCDGFKAANLSPIFLYFISRIEVSDRCDRLKLIIDKMIKDTLKLVDGGCQAGEIVKTTRHTRHTCHQFSASQHQNDIHTIIYLEQIIYAADSIISEEAVINTPPGTGTTSADERRRVLARYDQRNGDPHHRHWHRQAFGPGMVYLSKPEPFEPF